MIDAKASPVIFPMGGEWMALQGFLRSNPRKVRLFSDRLDLIWCNQEPGEAELSPFGEAPDRNLAVPMEGPERDFWPVTRVLGGDSRSERVYTEPCGKGVGPRRWRVAAWPAHVGGELVIVEETERIPAAGEDFDQLEQLNQDIEDLLCNVLLYLQNGIDGTTLRLPNPHIETCREERRCQNPLCPAHSNPTSERCWEVSRLKASDGVTNEDLLQKFHSCSQCRVFGLASPNPIVRIGENFNRLISLLQFKYHETLNLQHRMQQADKLAMMGELLAGIAHEIKNPLGIIVGRLDIMGLELEGMTPEELGEDLQTIYQQAQRVRQIIDHLLRMARPEPPDFAPVQLNSVVQDCLEMVRKALGEKQIQVETDLTPALPPIQADHIQMQQVLLNLILNARDAMAPGGLLRITSSICEDSESCIVLTVEDNGEGIPAEQVGKLFSSFHTTKLNQGGTGLGLAVCKRIMRAHNGRITAESIVKQGTTMKLWFPCPGK